VVVATPVRVAAGGQAEAPLRITIAPGWHVNANPPSPDYMIPTEITLAPAGGVSAGSPHYPAGQKLKVSFDASAIAVFSGTVAVSVPVSAAAGAAPGARRLKGHVRFQSCNDQLCLAPASVDFELPVTVTTGAGGATAHADTTAL